MVCFLKVQERAASLEHCPWCTSKGLTYALRSYRINLQESITLCTNPQCIFPLVSRPLQDVLASLDPAEPSVGNKRNYPLPLEKEESIKQSPKRLRSSELDSFGTQSFTDTLICQAELCVENTVSNGQQHAAPKADGEKDNGFNGVFDHPVPETTEGGSLQDEEFVLWKEPDDIALPEGFAGGDVPALSPHCGALGMSEAEEDSRQVKSLPELLNRRCSLASNQSISTNGDIYSTAINSRSPQLSEQTAATEQKPLPADVTTCEDKADIESETVDFSSTPVTDSDELVSVPNQLSWWNRDNLCWLDSLLTALVNCKSLRKCKPPDEPQQSSVWQLMRAYEDICAATQVHQQTGRDGVVRVPNHVLQKASADLHSLRMSVFKLLKPKLHCKLGKRETPVFAMPLLLAMDSWAEPLFRLTFQWEFRCSECGAVSNERFMKTLPTFTNIVRDWRPLHAVHLAPCNVCCRKNQMRTMMLESVPPVFVLHFVEGLPDDDVRLYTFNFKGRRYSVTTVIQYDQQLKHFVTWVCQSDGSWLEYDDLKHPDCETHEKLPVPAQEMHIVFWEVEEEKVPRLCSPSSTFSDSFPSKTDLNLGLSDKALAADEVSACSPDQSLLASHNDILCALSVSDGGGNIMETTVAADASIGSTTLLDTFEGLSHNDIITLTLVELKPDSEMTPVDDSEPTWDSTKKDVSPDSSSTVMDSVVCHGPDAAVPTTTITCSSDPASGDSSSSDPTFVPGARRGRGRGRGTGRGKTVGRQKDKKAASSMATPRFSPPVSSEVIRDKPVGAAVQDNTPPSISPEASSLPTTQNSPTRPTQDENARWSFLISRHPLNHDQKFTVKPAPTRTPVSATQVKHIPTTHSTPNPVRRQQIPGELFPRPQLRTEESAGLPLKAAEMYGGFSAKSSSTPSPALLSGRSKPFPPITSHNQKPLTNTTAASRSLLPTPNANRHPEISSSKNRSSRSPNLPPGLSTTDVLRYKLLKKLKAKKKKLAKLNEVLGHQGEASLRPESTDLTSPNTVTSTTYDGSICDDLLSDLLSPATTASTLSTDGADDDYLEMLVKGGVNQFDCGVNAVGAASQTNTCVNSEIFMDEFFSQASAQGPPEMDSDVNVDFLLCDSYAKFSL